MLLFNNLNIIRETQNVNYVSWADALIQQFKYYSGNTECKLRILS